MPMLRELHLQECRELSRLPEHGMTSLIALTLLDLSK